MRGRRLIEQKPIQADLRNRVTKILETHRLLYIAVCAQSIPSQPILFLFRGGQHHHGKKAGPRISPYPLQDLESVSFREFEVEQHERRQIVRISVGMTAGTEEPVECVDTVGRDDDVVSKSMPLESSERQFDVILIVLYQ
jgi:hypothetical protein